MKKSTKFILLIILSFFCSGFFYNQSQALQNLRGQFSQQEALSGKQDSTQNEISLPWSFGQALQTTSNTIGELIFHESISKGLICEPGVPASISLEAASLFVPTGSIHQTTSLTLAGLTVEDLPSIPGEISIVTKGNYAGYRFLPHGTLFDSAVTINLAYDQGLLPEGYTPEDIFTFYFDEVDNKWKALQRDSIDKFSGSVISSTHHFTDMINGIIKVPEAPETQGFVPTTMQDIKAADPAIGITLIEPPQANNKGDATITFPLNVPKGRNGMQPELIVQYNSSGSSSWTGTGWGIETPAITVDVAWGVPRYSASLESETYLLNGNQLAPVAHRDDFVSREAEKRFYPRVEKDFQKVIRHGAGPKEYWWELTDKSGVKYFYGGTPESGVLSNSVSIDNAGNIGYWPLVKTIDPLGNCIDYSYEKPSGSGQQIYVSEISYSGYQQEKGPYKISFSRADTASTYIRRDVPLNARYGFITKDTELLRRVSLSFKGAIIRSYLFRYEQGAFFKTLLESITEFNANGEEFYSQQFDYYNDVQQGSDYQPYKAEIKWDLPDDNLKKPYLNPVNIFLDNISSLGASGSVGASGGVSTTIGPFDGLLYSKINTVGGNVNYQYSKSEGFLSLADINGDGLSDKVYKKDNKVYYRPNLLGYPGNELFGTERLVQGIDNFSQSKTNAFGGGPEAFPGPVFIGYTRNRSTTKTHIYFSDFNGDGLVDVANKNTVYFNSINENGDPVFTTSSEQTPNPIYGESEIDVGILPDPAEEQTMLEQQFPLHDAVRVWQAPFAGKITLRAPVNLIDNTSEEAQTDSYRDGVKVSLQHGTTVLWSQVIGANDYSVKEPRIDSLEVARGDRLYFRLQSKYNGSYDEVNWDSEIEYFNIAGDDSLPNIEDSNNKRIGYFKASDDFIVCGKQAIGLPKDGAVRVKIAFSKPVTSDTVHLEVVYTDSLGNSSQVHYRKYNCEQVAIDDSVLFDLEVLANSYLHFKVYAESTVEWSSITCMNYAEYTRIDDGTPVSTDNGSPLFKFRTVPDFYTLYNHIARQEYPIIIDSSMLASISMNATDSQLQEIRIFPDLLFQNPANPNPTEDVLFALKRNDTILLSHTYSYNAGNLQNKDTLSAQVKKHDTLEISYYLKNYTLAENILIARAELISNANQVAKRAVSAFSTIYSENEVLGKLYRGWGQFDYKGDSVTTPAPIDESLLVPPNTDGLDVDAIEDTSDLAGIDIENEIFNIMIPYAERELYIGTDEYVYVKGPYMSSSRQGQKNVMVEPIVISETGLTAVHRESLEITNSVSAGAGVSFLNGSYSESWLNSNMVIDMMDMNGDHFPDLLTTEKIQYTGATGVLKGSPVSHSLGDHYSSARASGVGAGGSYVFAKSNNSATPESSSASTKKDGANAKEKDSKRDNKACQAEETSQSSLSLSGNLSFNSDVVEQTWLDINGDGLPDKITNDGNVRLNLGYSFAPAENWGFDTVSAGRSMDIGGGLGVNISNGSIEAGVGISHTNNEATYALLDLNADGLPDIVRNNTDLELSLFDRWPPVGNIRDITVQFNTGSGFASPVAWPDLGPLNQGVSVGESANTGFTVGIPLIPPTPIVKLCINPSGSVNRGVSKTITEVSDIDGDGYPDVLASGAENELYVKSSTIWRTNMLKSVEQALGSSFKVNYDYTPVTYHHPGGKLAFSSVVVFDGLTGDGADSTRTTFEYEGGYYDRHERQFYGYEIVLTNSLNTEDNNSLYRTVEQVFSNKDFYTNGLLLAETILDGNGKKQVGRENSYAMADIHTGEILPERFVQSDRTSLFPVLIESKSYVFAGFDSPQISTRETYTYDTLGNISGYTNYSSGNEKDRYTVNIKYHLNDDKYILNVPSKQSISTWEGLIRETSTLVDDHGQIIQIDKSISASESARFEMEYDDFGNLTKIIRPENYKGENLWYEYAYDPEVHTYVTSVTDAYGYSSSSEYDYVYGVLLSATDKNKQGIQYSYDGYGRTATITGPYDIVEGNSYTIAFEYHPEAEVPYSISSHNQPLYDSDIETITFIDGLKRVVQVKKTALLFTDAGQDDTPGFTVSGKIVYDAFGRKVELYQPVFEPADNPFSYNPLPDAVKPIINTYDVLDRVRSTALPDGSLNRMAYGAGSYKGEPMKADTLIDALGHTKIRYTKANSLQAAELKISANGPLVTDFEYNALGELLTVTDPNGNATQLEYDMLGRKTSVNHPDAGLTEYTYDAAGNLLKRITANLREKIPDGGAINYHYDLERVVEIVYPRNIQNRVNYTYGEPDAGFNRAGRIVLIEDAAGGQGFFYSPMGQVEKTIRTVQLGESDMRTFIWSANYDTWNRVQSMTYPDGELLEYTYDRAGKLQSMEGEKLGRRYSYLSRVGYNKFEKEIYVEHGNGAVTNYQYEPQRQRLSQVKLEAGGTEVMNNKYTYDALNNILSISSTTDAKGNIGGSSSQNYSYDELYRLAEASGEFTGSQSSANYTLSMRYDAVGNILSKIQENRLNDELVEASSYSFDYQYESSQPNAASQVSDRIFRFDYNGNQVSWEDEVTPAFRQLAWDEENRVSIISDDGYMNRYVYDASGERVIKSHGGTQGVYVNGAPVGILNHSDNNYTAYLSPYFVFRENGFTKHYYSGSTRILSKLGNGHFKNQFRQGVFEITAGSVNYINRQQQLLSAKEEFADNLQLPPGPPTMKGVNADPLITGMAYPDGGTPDHTVPPGWPQEPVFAPEGGPPGGPIQWGDAITNENIEPGFGYVGTGTIEENLQYFYHTDHLGSTRFITDAAGEVEQYIAYMPFGEAFVEQHTSWDNPYMFNGKELDIETGLYYYGARYYDPKLSTWLGVDPMALKSPSWSSYCYTFDNPVIYVDPDGQLPLVSFLRSAGQYMNKSFSKSDRDARVLNASKKQGTKFTTLDVSEVKVHSDGNLNKSLNFGARSYASGSDIHLGAGQEEIVGHEAVHVIQQSSSSSSTQPGLVFWSGGPKAMNAAMTYARKNGLLSLELTPEGQAMQARTKNMDWSQAQPLWSELSANFARSATGTVHVFQNAASGISVNSVWRKTEYPILKSNNINIVYHSVF